jgi:hypothetical protein
MVKVSPKKALNNELNHAAAILANLMNGRDLADKTKSRTNVPIVLKSMSARTVKFSTSPIGRIP